MRTVFFTNIYPPYTGGSGEFMRQIAEHCENVEYVLPRGAEVPGRGELLHRVCKPDRPRCFRMCSYALANLKLFFSRGSNETVVVYSILFYISIGGLLLRLRNNFKYTIILHGEELGRLIYRRNEQRSFMGWLSYKIAIHVLRGADLLVCNSRNTQDMVAELDPGLASRCRVVYPSAAFGENLQDIPAAPVADVLQGLQANSFVLAAGRLDARYKGFDRLIDALSLLEEDVRLVVAGPGDDQYLREMLPDVLIDRVVFAGRVSFDDLKWLFMNCRFFALPGRVESGCFEGFGIVFQEAAQCRKPFVCGLAGGGKEIIGIEDIGVAVDGEDVEGIAVGLRDLWNRTDLLVMGERAHLHCDEYFSIAAQAEAVKRAFLFVNDE